MALVCPQVERPVAPTPARGKRDTALVLVCGGVGARFGRHGGKQLLEVCGKPVFLWSLLALATAPSVAVTCVVCPAGERDLFEAAVAEFAPSIAGDLLWADAGATRQESVHAGLACVAAACNLGGLEAEKTGELAGAGAGVGEGAAAPGAEDAADAGAAGASEDPATTSAFRAFATGAFKRISSAVGAHAARAGAGTGAMEPPAYIAIHDGARPVITAGTLERLLKHVRAATPLAGVIAAYPSVDTIKLCEPDGTIVQTPPRDALWCVQTPQVFRAAAIIDAHSIARLVGAEGTDDSSLVEAVGGKVACVACPRNNIKLTLPEDISQVEAELAHLYGAGGSGASSDAGEAAAPSGGRGEGRSC